MKNVCTLAAFALLTTGLLAAPHASAQTFPVLAIGTLDQSRAGTFQDVSGLTYPLENGVRANELGGFGSALTWASGNTYLALPDRGPNAVEFDDAIDNTASYINRFHTIEMRLVPNTSGTGLPFTLTPHLKDTTLLWSSAPLFYGTGDGLGVGSGVPPINGYHRHYFTGRSDDFDPSHDSGDPYDARFDTEGIRVSNDGRSVFISDEYGPYLYQFDRSTGRRLRSFRLPGDFYVQNLSSVGATEISGNTSGRTANKGMEGLAITPDGRTLVGIMQTALIQDANEKGAAANLLRIVVIDIESGRLKHEYGYLLTSGSGVSEMLALNNHEFLVDERDGHGRANGDNAKVKQLFKIDLDGATDIRGMDGTTAASEYRREDAVPRHCEIPHRHRHDGRRYSRQNRRHHLRPRRLEQRRPHAYAVGFERQRLSGDGARCHRRPDSQPQPVLRLRIHRGGSGRFKTHQAGIPRRRSPRRSRSRLSPLSEYTGSPFRSRPVRRAAVFLIP